MRKTTKKLLTLTAAVLMAASSFLTAFAAEIPEDTNRLRLFGQELVTYSDDQYDEYGKIYLAIVDSADFISTSDFTPVDPSKTVEITLESAEREIAYMGGYSPRECSADGLRKIFDPTIELENVIEHNYLEDLGIYMRFGFYQYEANGHNYTSWIYITKLPAGFTAADMEEFSKFVIYRNGTQTTNTTTQPTDKGYGDWASDDKGWWIQYADGTYLTNGWWKSPTSGLWYYMGADGYMVTNTVIDGYTINADGVWVQ